MSLGTLTLTGLGPPTLAGFTNFVFTVMGVPSAALPSNSTIINMALLIAVDTVNQQLACVSPDLYTIAVYNLAGDRLINYAPDQPGQTFFQNARQSYNIGGFVGGVVASTSDVSTSESLAVPDHMKELTFSDLQNLKTPYGRRYLEIGEAVGTMWGLT